MFLLRILLVAPLLCGLCLGADDDNTRAGIKNTVELDYQSLLDEQVLKLTPFVEKKTGLKYKQTPKAKFPSTAEYKEVIKRGYPNAKDYTKLYALIIAMYDRAQKLIFVHPKLFDNWLENEQKGKDSKDWNMAPSLIHEMTHALQEQTYQLITKLKYEKDGQKRFVLNCLVDGHAALIEELYAEEKLKMKNYFSKRYNVRQHRAYVFGRNYLKRVWLADGEKGVQKVLGGEYPNSSTLIDMGYQDPDKEQETGK